MSGGAKVIQVNPRERAVSGDLNRLQALLGKSLAETMRFLLNVSGSTDDLDAGAIAVETTTSTSPMAGEILSGLQVKPRISTTAIDVLDGLALLIDPDATPSDDDSPYKLVSDPGLNDGSLTIAANGALSARVDVIECQRTTYASESVARDVYNTAQGVFNATTVTKATQSKLVYRVRQGVAGAGFPGTEAGWLPLAVAMMPAGGSTCDDATFWDVRPLVNDRWPSVQNVATATPRRLDAVLACHDTANARGFFDVAYAGRRLGGRLRRGSPGTDDANVVDLTANANQDVGSVSGAANGTLLALALVTPFGLPRWARYTDATSGSRVPRSPRGIPIVTLASKALPDGTLNLPVTFPGAFGFGSSATTSSGVVVAHFWRVSSAGFIDACYGTERGEGWNSKTPPTKNMTVGGPGLTVSLTSGTDFPSCARAVLLKFNIAFTPTSTGDATFAAGINVPGTSGAPLFNRHVTYHAVNGTPLSALFDVWMPIETLYEFSNLPFEFDVSEGGVTGAFTGGTAQVIGWRY